MSLKCGDDLIAARRFTNLCQDHMSKIFSGGELPLLDVIQRLSEIQSHAKLMHARSIYRSAQDVINDLTGRRSVQACAGSVLVLQRLIRQYETGLSQIAPVTAQAARTHSQDNFGPKIVTDFSALEWSKKVLEPLIQFADEEDQKKLTSLINLAISRPVKAEKTDLVNVTQHSETVRRVASSTQKIDVILPSLTNHWLRLARTQNKSISVSSSMDDVQIDSDRLKHLHTGLKHLGELLVSQSVEQPDKREARDLSRSAHLALTARLSGQDLAVLLSCEGAEPRTDDFNLIAETLKKTVGIKAQLTYDSDLIRIELSDLRVRNHKAASQLATGSVV